MGPSLVTNAPFLWVMLLTKETVHVLGQKLYANLCTFLSILLWTYNCSKKIVLKILWMRFLLHVFQNIPFYIRLFIFSNFLFFAGLATKNKRSLLFLLLVCIDASGDNSQINEGEFIFFLVIVLISDPRHKKWYISLFYELHFYNPKIWALENYFKDQQEAEMMWKK